MGCGCWEDCVTLLLPPGTALVTVPGAVAGDSCEPCVCPEALVL